MALWSSFHDKLPDTNSIETATELHGIVLKSQLLGRAKDRCIGIPDVLISFPDGMKSIIRAVRKLDPLSVVSDLYKYLN